MKGVLHLRSRMAVGAVAALLLLLLPLAAYAAIGSLLDTVGVPSGLANSNNCSVAAAFDGTYFYTMQGGFDVGCAGNTLQVFDPPAPDGVPGAPPDDATLVATKTIVDGVGAPVSISAVDWDPSRSAPESTKLWGAYADAVYLIDIGDPAISGAAVATFQFNPGVGGLALVDGLAWDANDDTLYYSPDVDLNVYQFSLGTGANPPLGTLMNTVAPKNAGGVADGLVSGVAIGAGNTLYIGRDGNAEIRRVDKTTGAFISTFATTAGRVEDLVCDPVTYAPLEAILAKDAYGGPQGNDANHAFYEAFEVEQGTCPLPQVITLDPPVDVNEAGTDHAVTATVTAGSQPIVGKLVAFVVTAGPNIGEVSDPGECSVNLNCTTDVNGQVSWTYTGSAVPGIDTIVACFTDDAGEEHCAEATKQWVDTTPPVAACTESVNPSGNNVPPAGSTTPPGSKGGKNEDGFYHLGAEDLLDPFPQIWVTDDLASALFGPFLSSTTIKLTQAPGAEPSIKMMGGPGSAVAAHIILPGEPQIYAVDASGNQSASVTCFVPPPPK